MSRLKLTDAQRRLVDQYRESFDYVEDRDPETALLRGCTTFAEKLLVVHGIHGLRGVAGVMNYAPYDKKRLRETVAELRKANTELTNTIADIVGYFIQFAPKHKPPRWEQLKNKRRTGGLKPVAAP
jgi:hypothetical protein